MKNAHKQLWPGHGSNFDPHFIKMIFMCFVIYDTDRKMFFNKMCNNLLLEKTSQA
jgi:hypothetical protein